MDMDQHQINDIISTHGTVTVTVQRGHQQKPLIRSLWEPDADHPPHTEVSSKTVVKDNHVSHAIR
jgi:hypothetical protein